MTQPQSSMEGSLFIQSGGPNTPVQYLGSCHRLTQITQDLGSNTLHYCGDPIQPNQYRISRKIKGPPGLVTFNIESQVQQLGGYLEQLFCPVPLIVTTSKKAPKKDDSNWDRAWVLTNADRVNNALDGLVNFDANDMTMRTTGMEADAIVELLRLRVYRDSDITETQALNHLFACDFDVCASEFSARADKCDVLYAVSDAIASSAAGTASVWKYTNGTWAALAADPFDTDENISTGTCFILDRDTTRLLVFRGTTDAGDPAEVARSDDGGATWTTVNIGSVNGEFVPGSNSLSALDRTHIWVGTNLGRIYFSDDGGENWTLQENATIQSGAYNWIEMMDGANGFAGGAADVLAVTADGGTTWSQLNATGNGGDILTGAVIDPLRVWVGTDDGELYYTTDGGVTWTERAGWNGSGTGDVKALRFFGDQIGYMIHQDAANKATFLMTKSGGANWETITTETNSGLNSLLLCSPRLLWAVGEAHGGRAAIFKVQPPLEV